MTEAIKTKVKGHGGKITILGIMTLVVALAVFYMLPTSSVKAAPEPMLSTPGTFAHVAEKTSPAVVNISTVKTIKGGQGVFRFQGPSGMNNPFDEFFRKFFGDQGGPYDRKARSLGSGFLVDSSGLIITNNHVVENADDIVVRMSNKEEFHAEILGRDPKTDLALIKIDAGRDLPHLNLGDSSAVRIGDWVVAIGNPFGLDHTVTAGILSARGRTIGAGPYDNFLQTDASINPGNSGGPLLNLNGEVIGINTAIIAGGQGIGFAIPANLAKNIVNQLKDHGKVVRGWLGVMIQDLTPELAKSFGLEKTRGALVADVTNGGPAAKAGFKRGDIIVSFNGRAVEEASDLPAMVAATPVGTTVQVVVVRSGREQSITVTIAELTDEALTESGTEQQGLGLTVREMTPEIAARLGLDETGGVFIADITPGSPAAEAGLKAGDLILEINQQRIDDMAAYQRIASRIGQGESALFLIKRGSHTLYFSLKTK